jgi:hypothetical protein
MLVKLKIWLFAATLAISLSMPGGVAGAGATSASDTSSITAWKGWVEGLDGAGYSVTQGGAAVIDIAACSELVAVFGTCFGNNAAAPYIVPRPPIGDTHVDPFYGTPFTTAGATGAPSNMFYRLADHDALVTIIALPPRAAYLGYQSYVFTAETSYYTEDYKGQVLSPNESRYEIFGSLGNNINDVIIRNRLGMVWNAGAIVYITTSNRELAATLIADAKAHGFDEDRIFVEPVGDNVLTGTGAAADDLLTLIRYALPRNATAADRWRDNVADNVLSFRVSASEPLAVSPFRTPIYTPKTANSEASYRSALAELSWLLQRWLIAHEGRPVLREKMITSEHVDATGQPHGLVGAECIAKGTNCLGDTQDTDAYRLGVVGRLPGARMAFVTGVNHALVDNATYVSLTIYNMQTFTGVASISQTNPSVVGFDRGSLTGSAEGVLKALGLYESASARLQAALPALYTAIIARECSAAIQYCVELDDTDALPLSSMVGVTQRAYIKPGTTTGANPDKLLTPIVVFRPELSVLQPARRP